MYDKTAIHQRPDNKWYFWNERSTELVGPFKNLLEAELGFDCYGHFLSATCFMCKNSLVGKKHYAVDDNGTMIYPICAECVDVNVTKPENLK